MGQSSSSSYVLLRLSPAAAGAVVTGENPPPNPTPCKIGGVPGVPGVLRVAVRLGGVDGGWVD